MKFKIFGILSLAILLVIFGSSVVYAETPEQIAKKHGIAFPIAELGGCVDYSSCHTFCEDPVNSGQCIDFAKKKGFYKEEGIQEKSSVIVSAKTELGCDSESSCRELCGNQNNWEKCGEFAKKHRISGGHTEDPKKAEILEKAKVELGCTSYEACMSFCHEEANRQKCSDFAKKSGLRGGEHNVGPGGCNSEETCRAFCSDPNNFQECWKFGRGSGGSSGGGFHGPGGCNSEESCQKHCEKNPQDCKIIISGEHGGAQDPRRASEMQSSTGTGSNLDPKAECVKYGCTWSGTNCQCHEGQYSSPTYTPLPPEGYSTDPSTSEGHSTPPSSVTPEEVQGIKN